ncbi:hypothetical protein Golob_005553, partial [Gossypium lobatum]|nr:hypothetical protein [Gossypium lobatum]
MKINCLHCMGNIDIQQSGEDTKHFIENYLLELEGIKKKLPVQRIEFEWRRPPETTHLSETMIMAATEDCRGMTDLQEIETEPDGLCSKNSEKCILRCEGFSGYVDWKKKLKGDM